MPQGGHLWPQNRRMAQNTRGRANSRGPGGAARAAGGRPTIVCISLEPRGLTAVLDPPELPGLWKYSGSRLEPWTGWGRP